MRIFQRVLVGDVAGGDDGGALESQGGDSCTCPSTWLAGPMYYLVFDHVLVPLNIN